MLNYLLTSFSKRQLWKVWLYRVCQSSVRILQNRDNTAERRPRGCGQRRFRAPPTNVQIPPISLQPNPDVHLPCSRRIHTFCACKLFSSHYRLMSFQKSCTPTEASMGYSIKTRGNLVLHHVWQWLNTKVKKKQNFSLRQYEYTFPFRLFLLISRISSVTTHKNGLEPA